MAKQSNNPNQQPPADKQPPKDDRPTQSAGEKLVKVEVRRAIAFGGLRIGPKVDGQQIIPVLAYIPRGVAESHTLKRVKILGDAPASAKIGVIED